MSEYRNERLSITGIENIAIFGQHAYVGLDYFGASAVVSVHHTEILRIADEIKAAIADAEQQRAEEQKQAEFKRLTKKRDELAKKCNDAYNAYLDINTDLINLNDEIANLKYN